jgi:hypothetical protein
MFCFFAPAVNSQAPGGVKGAIQWYCTDNSTTIAGLRSRLPNNNNLLTFSNASIAPLNFHPSLVLPGTRSLHIDLGTRDLRNASYFTVYQPLDTSRENSIWHIANNQQATLVLTTDRMADLSAYQYMNYTDVIHSQPKVNVYVQHKGNDSTIATHQSWNIGVKPTSPQVPVVNFKGLVPEIIAFDRVLNTGERLQVASYLALKYGITLTEPGATYLNSSGQEIWNGYDYTTWHHSIAGICRDDSGGLRQTIASSSNMPGLMTIQSKDSLTNNSFLLWGDNGRTLITAPRLAGLPLFLQKTWLMKTYGNANPFRTDIVINTKEIDASLPEQPVYWLAIDPTGEGKFDSPTTEFIKMDRLDGEGKAFFNNIVWDKDNSGKDVWGVIAAQELLLAAFIRQPTCTAPRTGSLQIKILGGQAPYQFTLLNNNGVEISKRINDALSPLDFDNLEAGKYFLKITDAQQHVYADSFYINNQDAPATAMLADHYILHTGSSLRLNASENMPNGLVWEWSGPANYHSFNPQITITEPGLYTLHVSKDGCGNEQDIKVTAVPDNILYDITVYPNPSQGAFKASVALDKPAPVTMSVYTQDGKLVLTQKGDNRSNYLFTGELKASLSKTNKKLVIVK